MRASQSMCDAVERPLESCVAPLCTHQVRSCRQLRVYCCRQLGLEARVHRCFFVGAPGSCMPPISESVSMFLYSAQGPDVGVVSVLGDVCGRPEGRDKRIRQQGPLDKLSFAGPRADPVCRRKGTSAGTSSQWQPPGLSSEALVGTSASFCANWTKFLRGQERPLRGDCA